jgi:Tfp pilus assembly protein PilV
MKARSRPGFILLEVIFATTLVSIGLFALINCLGRCIAAARSIQQYTIAETLLANQCCVFRVERPKDFESADGEFPDFPGFTWSRTFEATEIENLWIQTITVSWEERGRRVGDSVTEYRFLPEKQP